MWFMKRVSLRAFDCALGTQKRLTTAGGTHVSVSYLVNGDFARGT